jgi:hypothetical protein
MCVLIVLERERGVRPICMVEDLEVGRGAGEGRGVSD